MSLETRIVHNAADAIIAADASGKIRLWNAGAERLFGFSAAEALDQSLDIIIPEAQRQRHWDGYAHVMQTGLTKYGSRLLRVPAVRKDGRRISIAFTVGLLKDAAGSVEGIFAVMRDDTERWETEKELRRRVADLEQRVPHDSHPGRN
ncbi:MAG TPA: PAS domain S-box protein [Candidatus Acidoferrum sp.]|nr:PAS domain S-box protein [Candidatus Acidoferrum sp.]